MAEVVRVEDPGGAPMPSTPTGAAVAARTFRIEVRLFASTREAVGRELVEVDLEEGACASDLLDSLGRAWPAVARQRRSLAVAVNLAIVPPSHRLRPGDEVALLPPVGGG